MAADPMKVVQAYPPNYAEICIAIPAVASWVGVLFAYGDVIYAPHPGSGLSGPLRVHEETHRTQQQAFGSVDGWWKKYLADPAFRLSQEIEAYRAQYRAMSKSGRMQHIRRIAGDICSDRYGGLISFRDAKAAIRAGTG